MEYCRQSTFWRQFWAKTQPKKPYWVGRIADSFVEYLNKEFSIIDNKKYELNKKILQLKN